MTAYELAEYLTFDSEGLEYWKHEASLKDMQHQIRAMRALGELEQDVDPAEVLALIRG